MIILMKTLQVVLALGILVLIHEFGHFFFAKLFGIKVNTGLSNGLQTEIIGGDLKAGDSLITGIDRGAVMMPGKAGGGSPFMPKPPPRKNQNRAQQSQREKNAAAGGF